LGFHLPKASSLTGRSGRHRRWDRPVSRQPYGR
jgi:hypothetical protein